MYDVESALHTDVRNPKRKLAWPGNHMETLFLVLPTATKGQRKVVERDLYTKAGEATNFSRSYTGVPFRNLAEIPRVTEDGKKAILGPAAIGAFTKDRVVKEVKERGHPLFWGEWKPVKLFSTLYRDLHITDVVDVTPGSGAACLAAMYNSIPYFGFSINEKHRKWFMDQLQNTFLALVYSKEVEVEKLSWRT